ncbi:hypothetical protein ASE74_13960 [Pedobacter sp. Leaf216]|nr:hypothetical protein ASE74_13960 [Pedobacter sp. Leaf216]
MRLAEFISASFETQLKILKRVQEDDCSINAGIPLPHPMRPAEFISASIRIQVKDPETSSGGRLLFKLRKTIPPPRTSC